MYSNLSLSPLTDHIETLVFCDRFEFFLIDDTRQRVSVLVPFKIEPSMHFDVNL